VLCKQSAEPWRVNAVAKHISRLIRRVL
jgi:hypothetical protein